MARINRIDSALPQITNRIEIAVNKAVREDERGMYDEVDVRSVQGRDNSMVCRGSDLRTDDPKVTTGIPGKQLIQLHKDKQDT